MLQWKGKLNQLGLPSNAAPSQMMRPCLFADQTGVVYHSARIKPLSNALRPVAGVSPVLAESALVGAATSTIATQLCRDVAPECAVLAGIEVFGDEKSLRGLRPVYQKKTTIIQGQAFGGATGLSKIITPKDGYAIAGFDVLAQTFQSPFSRLRVVFMRRNSNGLDASDVYVSEWFGSDRNTGHVIRITGNGRPLVGIKCSHYTESRNQGIGVIAKSAPGDSPVLSDSGSRYALGFNGQGIVRTPLVRTANTAMTVEAFVTPQASGLLAGGCIAVQDVDYGGMQLGISGGFFVFAQADISRRRVEVRSDSPVEANRRYHVAGVFDGTRMRMYVEKAIEFIESHEKQHKDQPFFVYLPLNAIHGAVEAPQRFVGKTGMTRREDKILWANQSAGKMLAALDRMKLADETLLIFTSDNGPINSPRARKKGHQPTGPYRGLKTNVWDGGTRVPFIARWRGHIPASVVTGHLIGLTDMLATFAALCNESLPDKAGPDSINQLPVLLQQKEKFTHRPALVTASYRGFLTLRKDNLKVIFGTKWTGGHTNEAYGGLPPKGTPFDDPSIGQLYNIIQDPYEQKDLWKRRPEIVKKLRHELEEIKQLDENDEFR